MPIRFETLAVHGGQHPDPTTLSRGVPVYRTSSYLFKSAEHAAKLFGLAEQGNVYGRLGNPTQAMLEERMSLLEGGVGALASASGTSAIFSTIVNLAKQGDEIVSANNLYGGTFTLFNDILPQFGITTRFVKPQDFDKMEAAVNGRTRALYVEAIGNPALDVADQMCIRDRLPSSLPRPPSYLLSKTFDWWGGRATGVRFSEKEEEQGDTRKMEQFRFEMFQGREPRSP